SPVKINALFPGPHPVSTGIYNSARNRPAELPDDPAKPTDTAIRSAEDMQKLMEKTGVKLEFTSPDEFAETALQDIRDDKFWILPLTEALENAIKDRNEAIIQRTPLSIVALG
ncbi:SDR family oxidoreductase, partial [Pseudomaricurvus alkylphenolicus]|nr:SDR family oxidoreductase [Pseudomaricurvus alkylphenolicus]